MYTTSKVVREEGGTTKIVGALQDVTELRRLPFIQKPFSMQLLAARVREVLDAGEAAKGS